MNKGAPTTTFGRVGGALPEAISAGFFLAAWLMPAVIGAHWIKTMMLVLLFEFISIHSSAFMIGISEQKGLSRAKRTLAMLGLGVLYLGFAAAFSAIFDDWWPIAAFLWLLVGKIIGLWQHADKALDYGKMVWAASTLFFILAVVIGAVIPFPALMITDEIRAQAAIPGNGLWVDNPQRMLASGVLYFGALTWLKLKA